MFSTSLLPLWLSVEPDTSRASLKRRNLQAMSGSAAGISQNQLVSRLVGKPTAWMPSTGNDRIHAHKDLIVEQRRMG